MRAHLSFILLIIFFSFIGCSKGHYSANACYSNNEFGIILQYDDVVKVVKSGESSVLIRAKGSDVHESILTLRQMKLLYPYKVSCTDNLKGD